MKIKLLHRLFLGSALLLSSQLFSPLVLANDTPASKPDFASYTSALKQEALSRGYDASLLDAVFSSLQFHERVVSADRSQPEVVETLDTYLPKRVSETRIRMARERYQLDLCDSQQSARRGAAVLNRDLEVLVYTWSARLRSFDHQLDELEGEYR